MRSQSPFFTFHPELFQVKRKRQKEQLRSDVLPSPCEKTAKPKVVFQQAEGTLNGNLTYAIESPDVRNIKLKKQQYNLSENIKGLKIAKELIKCKMKNQKATLTTLNKKKQFKNVKNSRLKIEEYINQLKTNNFNKIQIMGLEGKASNEYWSCIKYFIPEEIGFKSRTRKPTDLLNSMLIMVMQYLQVK